MHKDEIDAREAFAQDIVAVIRKHGAHSVFVTFRLNSPDDGYEETKMNYQQGRHGALGMIKLTSTTVLHDIEERIARDLG